CSADLERLRTEIELLLKEKEPLRAVKRMKSLDELKFISLGIRFGGTEAALLKSIKKVTALYGKYFSGKHTFDLWFVYFMAMIDKLTLNDALKVCDRLVMKRSDKMSVISAKKHGKKIIALLSDKKDVRPGKIYGVLKPLSCETLLFIAAKCRGSFARRRIGRFLAKDRAVQLLIKGSDLKSLGAQPGPCFTVILKKTLYAKIDGLISTKQDELLFAKKQITHETEIS
ncbi:MAG: hypothetical protein PHI59_08250, partial [Candidatus Omnitrophica bacterium]|nr:hypothetical protein [Candidatus Omnitrophota bacterium]